MSQTRGVFTRQELDEIHRLEEEMPYDGQSVDECGTGRTGRVVKPRERLKKRNVLLGLVVMVAFVMLYFKEEIVCPRPITCNATV